MPCMFTNIFIMEKDIMFKVLWISVSGAWSLYENLNSHSVLRLVRQERFGETDFALTFRGFN